MTREELYSFISEKYEGLKQALKGTDLERIKELTLEVRLNRYNPWCLR